MKHDIQTMKVEAQHTLEELYVADLLPFRLVAHLVESLGMEEYIVRFYDSRLNSLDLSVRSDEVFRAVFRAAILNRVARLGSHFQMARSA